MTDRSSLQSGTPAAAAARRLLLALADAVEEQVDGVCRDLDVEFLHDFRVAVRRTRTALTEIRGVLPPRVVETFRTEFERLGRLTGTMRDLDVLLLRLVDYEADVSVDIRRRLDRPRRELAAWRARELDTVRSELASERFRRVMSDWRSFLQTGATADRSAPEARTDIVEVARRSIQRAYARFLERGRAIGDQAAPSALHRLRISGKKLRYLLEFFRVLLGEEEANRFIRSLKRLQDSLGDFNDYGIQARLLGDLREQMKAERPASLETLETLDRITELLQRRSAAARRRCLGRFEEFDAEDSHARLEALVATRAS